MAEELTSQTLIATAQSSTGVLADPSPLTAAVPTTSTAFVASPAETLQPLSALNSANNIVPLSANTQSALNAPPPALRTTAAVTTDPLLGEPLLINDSDLTPTNELNKVQYSGRWNVTSDSSSYQGDGHWTDAIGATYKVRFEGSQIKLFGSKTPWHGLAGISIDGGPEILVDTFSTSVISGTVLYENATLTEGVHTLTVRVTGQKNAAASGHNLFLDKLEVRGATVQPTVPPTTTSSLIIDDQDLGNGVNKVRYTGIWTTGESTTAYGGSSRWTANTGATYTTQFYGSEVRLFGDKAPWHGIAAISVDGGAEVLIDTYGSSFSKTLLYANTGLTEGLHTLRVRVTGQRNASATGTILSLDQLEVTSNVAAIATPPRQVTSTVTIDDRDVGAGVNKVRYTGSWSRGEGATSFNGSNSWTKVAGATYTAQFSGTQIQLFGGKAPWHGVAGISIDGGPETLIDTYATSFFNNTLLYSNTSLTQGTHTITVRVTGQRTANATDSYLLIDRLVVRNTNSNVVAPSSTMLNFSPYTWMPVGDAVQTSNAGAYIKFRFNGSQAILNFDTQGQTSFPLVDVFVNGRQTGSELWLKNANSGQVQIFSGAAGDHDAVVYFRRREFVDGTNPDVVALRQNDWSTDAQHLRVTGITVNGGSGFLNNPFRQEKRALFFGDSITEGGVQSYGPGPDRPATFPDANIPQSQSYKTYAARLGDLLGVEYGQVGWSGSGWLRPSTPTGEPPFLESWLKYNGQSPVTRDFTPEPDYVFVNLGTNDAGFNVTNTAYEWLELARQEMPNAEIFVIFPFNQTKNAELQAAVNRYRTNFPIDTKVRILNLGAEGARGLQSTYIPELAIDQVHPSVSRHQELAGLLYDQIKPLIGSPRTIINNSDTASATGLNTVVYTGAWNREVSATAINQDLHVSNTVDSFYEITLRGSRFQLYGVRSAQGGIAGISINGAPEIIVDTFNSTTLNNSLLYQSNVLTNGFHTVKVRVTGQRNAAATNNFIWFDRLEVL